VALTLPPLTESWDPAKHPRDRAGKFAEKDGLGIPRYDAKLTLTKPAGGSNGAMFAKSADGQRWLVKGYRGDRDRVATEALANAVYREMGARVPRAGVMRAPDGSTVLAYPLVEGKPAPMTFHQGGPSRRVAEHFMTDALLANWDVAGLEDDNILWSPEGDPIRVDQGGTMEFRAMGGRKDFGPVPLEVSSMLSPGGQGRRSSRVRLSGMRKQALEIEKRLTPERIDALLEQAPFEDQAMRDRVGKALKARVKWMGRWARGHEQIHIPLALQEGEGFWLLEATISAEWNEKLHPRDEHGKFIEKIKVFGGKGVQLDAKTVVKLDKDGTYRVVRSGGITKGFKTPEDAARDALDKSAKGAEADSIGGAQKFKDYNDFLKQHADVHPQSVEGKVPNVDVVNFGGKLRTLPEMDAEVARLGIDLDQAKLSPDKYRNRAVKTLEARLKEAKTKRDGLLKTEKPEPQTPDLAKMKAYDKFHNAKTGTTYTVTAVFGGGKYQVQSDNPGAPIVFWQYDPSTSTWMKPGPAPKADAPKAPEPSAPSGEGVMEIAKKLGTFGKYHSGNQMGKGAVGLKKAEGWTYANGTPIGDTYKVAVGGSMKHYASKLKAAKALASGEHNSGGHDSQEGALIQYGAKPPVGAPSTPSASGMTVADATLTLQQWDGVNPITVNGKQVQYDWGKGYTVDGKDFSGPSAAAEYIVSGSAPGVSNVSATGPLVPDQEYQVKTLGVNAPVGAQFLVKQEAGNGTYNQAPKVQHIGGGKYQYVYADGSTSGSTYNWGEPGGAASDFTMKYVGRAGGGGDAPVKLTPEGGLPGAAGAFKGKKQSVTQGSYIKNLDLAVGDTIQLGKGQGINTIKKVGTSGAVWVETPQGKTKPFAPYTMLTPSGHVIKADGSKLQPKAPTKPAEPEITAETIKSKLADPPPGMTIGSLQDGDVILTPDGKVGILKPGEDAYTGYVAAYDINTGQKFEPPAGKPPVKYSNASLYKDAAAKVLANAQSGTKVTTASGASGTTGSSPSVSVGPPAEFSGIASWNHGAKFIPGPNHKFGGNSVSLTSEERQAVKGYTGSGYTAINEALRNSQQVKGLDLAKRIRLIDKAIAKATVEQDVIIGRKTNNPTWKTNAKAGQVVQDNGFLSSSVTEGTWSGDIYLNILVRKGSNALLVQGISNHPDEDEVMLPRGSQFHVLKREEKGGATVLYVEMI